MTRPSAKRIRALLEYEQTTGRFRWKRPTVRQAKGWFKGNKSVRRYRRLYIEGHHYLAHVIAFVIVKGRWPRHEITRRDRDQENNRWHNLRELPHSKVAFNRRKHKNNTTGYRGVSKYLTQAGRLRFRVVLGIYRQRLSLGLFDTPECASEAWSRAAEQFYGDAYVP
jgi:hypothetical protein